MSRKKTQAYTEEFRREAVLWKASIPVLLITLRIDLQLHRFRSAVPMP